MDARAHHQPYEFAAVDFDATHLGRVCGAVTSDFSNQHTILLTGRTDPTRYGELVHWDDDQNAMTDCFSRKQQQLGEGLLILEVQQKILSFLRKCAELMLHDVPTALLLDAPVMPGAVLSSEADTGFDSLLAMALERPYRSPAKLSWDRITSLLGARKEASMDHGQ